MKKHFFRIFALVVTAPFLLTACNPVSEGGSSSQIDSADLNPYPVYKADLGLNGLKFSNYFDIKYDGKQLTTFDFLSNGNAESKNAQKFGRVSFTQFDTVEPGKLVIDCKNFNLKSYKILPSAFDIQSTREGNTITVDITDTKKFMIEFNGEMGNNLCIWPNAPETDIPEEGDSSVWRFKAGTVTNIGNLSKVPDNKKTIYIESGAVVVGSFSVTNGKDLTIRGRGILYNGEKGRQSSINAVRSVRGSGLTVKDLMVIGSANHTIVLEDEENATLSNLKLLSPFWYNTDGFQLKSSPGAVLEDTFIFTNDDSICMYSGDQVARNNVVANIDNGCAVSIDFWACRASYDILIEDLYIMYGQHSWTKSAIEILEYNQEPCSNVRFKNIHAENINASGEQIENGNRIPGQFLRIQQQNRDCDKEIFVGYAPGKIHDILFKDVYLYDGYGGMIKGYDDTRYISDIYFNNVNIKKNGTWSKVTNLAEFNMPIYSFNSLSAKSGVKEDTIYFNKPYVAIAGDPDEFVKIGNSKKVLLTVSTMPSSVTKTELYVDGALYKTNADGSLEFTIGEDKTTAGYHTMYAVVTAGGATFRSREYQYFAKEGNQLLQNFDFSAGTSYWNPTRWLEFDAGGTWARFNKSTVVLTNLPGQGHDGKNAVKVSGRNGTDQGIYQSFSGQLVRWYEQNPGGTNKTITLTAWVKNESGTSNMNVNVKRYSWSNTKAIDGIENQKGAVVSVGTGWTKITVDYTFNVSQITASHPSDLGFFIESSNPNSVYYISDCSITIS